MVYLRDLPSQWPFNAAAEPNYEDKEIYTQFVREEDSSKHWRIRIYAPMPGFVYTAMRITVADAPNDYSMSPTLVMGATNNPVFGAPWDHHLVKHKEWHALNFPLTHRMLAISEDEIDIVLQHNEPLMGKVELVAQRLEDFEADEMDMTYAFLDDRTRKVAWVMTPTGNFYRPHSVDRYPLHGKIKIVPSLRRILDKNMPLWEDCRPFRKYAAIHEPLLDIAPWAVPQV